MNKKKALLGAGIVIVLIIIMAWAVNKRQDAGADLTPITAGLADPKKEAETFSSAIEKEIALKLSEAAQQLNKEVPKQVNETTTLDKVDVNGLNITYRYSLMLPHDGSFTQVKAKASIELIARVCTVPEMRDYMGYGASYSYVYKDAGSGAEFSTTINNAICTAFEQEQLRQNEAAAKEASQHDAAQAPTPTKAIDAQQTQQAPLTQEKPQAEQQAQPAQQAPTQTKANDAQPTQQVPLTQEKPQAEQQTQPAQQAPTQTKANDAQSTQQAPITQEKPQAEQQTQPAQ